MFRIRRSGVWLIGLGILVAMSAGTAQSPWDAGGGQDASNSMSSPTKLPHLGTYSGTIPEGDADWYSVALATSARCLVLTLTTSIGAEATLAYRGDFGRSVTANTPAGEETRISIAGPGISSVRIGLRSTQAAAASYTFTVSEVLVGPTDKGDGGSGGDAPGRTSNAVDVSHSCLQGQIGGIDTADIFAFRATAGDMVVYSLARVGGSGARLTIIDASGVQLAPMIASGGIDTFRIPADATYYLAVTAPLDAEPAQYGIGFVGPDPPPGNPCRPTCMVT